MFSRAAQTAVLHFFPKITLLIIKLARQGLDRDIVQFAEVTPENKPLVKFSGLIGNYVVDWWILFLLRHADHLKLDWKNWVPGLALFARDETLTSVSF